MQLRIPVPRQALQPWPCHVVSRAFDEAAGAWGDARPVTYPPHVGVQVRSALEQHGPAAATKSWCASPGTRQVPRKGNGSGANEGESVVVVNVTGLGAVQSALVSAQGDQPPAAPFHARTSAPDTAVPVVV